MAIDATSGFTGNDVTTRVINYIGNQSPSFRQFVEQSLTLAENRFCNMHDWAFLYKAGLELPVSTGAFEYSTAALSDGVLTWNVDATNIETIYDTEAGNVIKRLDLNQIRRFNPKDDQGTAADSPTLWAPVGTSKIRFWPATFGTRTLNVDAKITPIGTRSLSDNLASYSIVPYKYQESFIAYVVAMALDRENDSRAFPKKQEAILLIKEDIKADLNNQSNTDNPRIKSMLEKRFDGAGSNIEAYLLGFLDDYSGY